MKMLWPVLALVNSLSCMETPPTRTARRNALIARLREENSILRKHLSESSAKASDMGSETDLESGMRPRTISHDDIGDFTRSLSDSFNLQTHALAGIHASAAESARHRNSEREYNRRTRKYAMISAVATFAYATVGFILTNRETIGKALGISGGHPGNSTGT